MFARLTTVIATICLLSSTVKASGQIAQVVDATNFCVFLPPNSETNRNIADTEWDANAFCMGSTPGATGADKLPDGFITSAHYVATDAYVQVTGMMDYTKANLNGTDEGGQYDIKAPTGSSCAGWSYYVNLIEPVSNTYCIRCCNDTVSCNRGISEKGCAHIIPGDYSGPGASSATTTSAAAAASSTTVASTTTTTTTKTTHAPTTTSTTAAAGTTANSASSNGTSTDGAVHEQSVNAAGTMKPYTITLITGAFISAVLFA